MSVIVDPRMIEAEVSPLLVLVAPAPIAAGFPSPAQDYCEGRIDPNEHLIRDITSTFVVRACGESMECAGISDGDELIVHRALESRDGCAVVAVRGGELTIRRLRSTPAGVVLHAKDPTFPDIRVPALVDPTIRGVAQRGVCTTPNARSCMKCEGGHV